MSRPPVSEPLSPEDLSFWWADQPRQRTTMAMLMLLDRRPDPVRLRAAAVRAVAAVPRLGARVVDAPFDLALPRWEADPTFDLDFHVRRYALAARAPEDESELDALFRTVGPIYERAFDRTRPLWELVELDRSRGRSAIFFRLHHAVADGVGGNAIFAALTDATRAGEPLPPPVAKAPGAWGDAALASRLARALRDRAQQDAARARAVAGTLWQAVRDPGAVPRAARVVGALAADAAYRSPSPLRSFGRARHLAGVEMAFPALRAVRAAWGGRMIDVLLTGVAGAVGRWHADRGLHAEEILTLVPINLRSRADQGLSAGVGNRATGILVRLPLGIEDPRARFEEVRRRVEERKAHPAATFFPQTAAILATLPRPLYRSLAHAASRSVGLIVTNVPGLSAARYVAGAEITAAYPFAPVAPSCPVSVALYGYRDRLFIGLDADGTAMPDLPAFRERLREAFDAVVAAAGPAPPP